MTEDGTLDNHKIVEQPPTFAESSKRSRSEYAVPIGAIRAMKGMAGMEGMGIMRVNVPTTHSDSNQEHSDSSTSGDKNINGKRSSHMEAPDASKPSAEFSAPSRSVRRGPGRPRKGPVTVHHTHLHKLAPREAENTEYISNHDDVSPPVASRPQMHYRLSRQPDGDKTPDRNSELETTPSMREPAMTPKLNYNEAKLSSSPKRRQSTEKSTQEDTSRNQSITSNSPRRTSKPQDSSEFPHQSPQMQDRGFTTSFSPTPYPHVGPNGFPPNGFPPNGFPPNGFPPNGVPPNGVPPNGMSPNGMPPNGIHANSGSPPGPPPNGTPPNGAQPTGMPPFGPHHPMMVGMNGIPLFLGGMPMGYHSPFPPVPMMNPPFDQSRAPPGAVQQNGETFPARMPDHRLISQVNGFGPGSNFHPIGPPSSIPNSLLGNSGRASPPLQRKKPQSHDAPLTRRKTYGTGGDGFDVFRYSLTTPPTPMTPDMANGEIKPTPSEKTPSSENSVPNSTESAKQPEVVLGASLADLMQQALALAKEGLSTVHNEERESLNGRHNLETEALSKQHIKQQNCQRYDTTVDVSRREVLRVVQVSEHENQKQQLEKQQAKEMKKLMDKQSREISNEQRERFVQLRQSLKDLEVADLYARRAARAGKATDSPSSEHKVFRHDSSSKDPEGSPPNVRTTRELESLNETGENSSNIDKRDSSQGFNDSTNTVDIKENKRPSQEVIKAEVSNSLIPTSRENGKSTPWSSESQFEWIQGVRDAMYDKAIETANQVGSYNKQAGEDKASTSISKQAEAAMDSLLEHQDADIRRRNPNDPNATRIPTDITKTLSDPGLYPNPNSSLLSDEAANANSKLIYTVAERGRVQSVVTPAPVTPDVPLRRVSSHKPQRGDLGSPRLIRPEPASGSFAPIDTMNQTPVFPHNMAQGMDPYYYFQMMQNGSLPPFPYVGTSLPYSAVPHPLMAPPNAPNNMTVPIGQPMMGGFPPMMPGMGFPIPSQSPGQQKLATPHTTPKGNASQLQPNPSVTSPIDSSIEESRKGAFTHKDHKSEEDAKLEDTGSVAPPIFSDTSPPIYQMSTKRVKRSESFSEDNDGDAPRPSKIQAKSDKIPQVVMPISQSSQESISTDIEDSVNDDYEECSMVKSHTRSTLEKPIKGRKPKGDPNDPNSLENIPRSERYWLDQQNQFMTDLNNLGFEAISKSNNQHECSLCKKVFHSRLLCIRHAAEHLSRKAFWCIECGLEFTRCDTLQRHFKGRCEKRNIRREKAESTRGKNGSLGDDLDATSFGSSPKPISGGMRVVRPSPSLQLSQNTSSGAADSPKQVPPPLQPPENSLSDSDDRNDTRSLDDTHEEADSDDDSHSSAKSSSRRARAPVMPIKDEEVNEEGSSDEAAKSEPPVHSENSEKDTRPRIPGPVLPPSLASV